MHLAKKHFRKIALIKLLFIEMVLANGGVGGGLNYLILSESKFDLVLFIMIMASEDQDKDLEKRLESASKKGHIKGAFKTHVPAEHLVIDIEILSHSQNNKILSLLISNNLLNGQNSVSRVPLSKIYCTDHITMYSQPHY